ncbi:hypothetical protein LB465_15320 [Salegentibacter sp. LM13S]|uniref:hypothetical protein n=1 Tax=Salegentibacter lacus TaxID=2873599 RepID=UPI001CCEF608|nr:hypothetical protein [Salegentibacter lacus]MBZ9632152.1 hypothetical protein [Salegentibacter lacus]
MKRIFIPEVLIIIVFFTFQSFNAQEDFILSKMENQEWLKNLKNTRGLDAQLAKIRHRMLQDTAVYFNYRNGDFETERQKKELKGFNFKEESPSRPLYIVAFAEERLLLDVNPEKGKIEKIVEVLKKVSKIEVLKTIKPLDFKGEPAMYSSVRITIEDESVYKKIAGIIEANN